MKVGAGSGNSGIWIPVIGNVGRRGWRGSGGSLPGGVDGVEGKDEILTEKQKEQKI